MKKRTSTKSNLLPVGFILCILLVWEIVINILEVPKYILPSPSNILKALYRSREVLAMHAKTTMIEAVIGFAAAIVLALLLSGLMNRWAPIKRMFYPVLVISQTVPIIVLAPLIMIWMGFGIMPKIAIVILTCFFPIVISITEGLETVDEDIISMMKVMRASGWQIFTKVKLPAVLPAFFSGLKIAATYSIMGAVIAEWIGAQSGLGVYMTRAMHSFRTEELFADILIIVALSVGMFEAINYAGKRIMPWNK